VSVSDELLYFVIYAKGDFFLTKFEADLTSFDAFNDNALRYIATFTINVLTLNGLKTRKPSVR